MRNITRAFALALLLSPIVRAEAYVSFGDTRYMHPDGGANVRDDVGVHLETDGAGNWVAATTGPYVSTSSDNGDTWTTPVLVPGVLGIAGFWAFEPMVVTDRQGTWLLVWAADENFSTADGEVYISRSTDNGATWTTGVAFASNALTDSEYNNRPRLATDGVGNWMAVWHEGDPVNGDDDIRFTTSTDNGLTWAPVDWVNGAAPFDTIDQNFPSVSTDGAGNWVVACNEFGAVATAWRIKTFRSSDFGANWGSITTLGQTLGLAVVDLDSGGIDSFVTAHAGTETIVSTSSDGGMSWGGQSTISRPYGSAQARARIATDGNGEWVAVWDSEDDPFVIGGGDYDIIFAHSVDNAEDWSRPDFVDYLDAATDGETDGWSEVATDGVGRWIAAWQRSGDIMMAISDVVCPAEPRTDCVTGEAGKSLLNIANQDGVDRDKLKFKLSRGGATTTADFGDPASDDDVILCLWDATGGVDRLVWQSIVSGGGTCDGSPCWTASPTGFSYSDKEMEHSGISGVKLKAGDAGKTGISVQGGGSPGLKLPSVPLESDSSVAFQILSEQSGKCFGATFGTPKKNADGKYLAKSN